MVEVSRARLEYLRSIGLLSLEERRLRGGPDRPFLPGLGNEEGRKLTAVAPLLF